MEVARILEKEAGISAKESKLASILIGENEVPFLEIHLKITTSPLDKKDTRDKGKIRENFDRYDFVNYSTYHLLLDSYLKKEGKLEISTRDRARRAIPLLDIEDVDGKRIYTTHDKDELKKIEGINKDEVNNALSRSGLFLPPKWQDIGNKLSQYDDVILGLDTNILYNCSISRHLLPIVSLVEPKEYVHTPNWLLLIVPSTVMYELEEAANTRDDRGLLTYRGRKGFRALQEAMELSERINIPGVSLLIHGETNPVLDMKNNIFAIRGDIHRYINEQNGTNNNFRLRKSSGGDMAIRNQFKNFLNQVNFHKGTFFLSTDKSCTAMAMAEGLCPVYIPYNHLANDNLEPFSITGPQENGGKESHKITFSAPLGNILYELAVSFGEIVVSCGDQTPSIKCDCKGDDIGRWVHKQLQISKDDLELLLKNYSGRFNLDRAGALLKNITKLYERVEWINEMDGALEL